MLEKISQKRFIRFKNHDFTNQASINQDLFGDKNILKDKKKKRKLFDALAFIQSLINIASTINITKS